MIAFAQVAPKFKSSYLWVHGLVMAHVQKGTIHLGIDSVYPIKEVNGDIPFEDTNDAHQHMTKNENIGKIILVSLGRKSFCGFMRQISRKIFVS